MNIKNAETERLVKELAQRIGKSQTGAITVAVQDYLSRLDRRKGSAERAMAIARETGPLFKEPFKSMEHGDLLYDPVTGLPK